ncbi:sensor histidine kinase [Nonomuraea glycinis]|jgi:two-component system sensor histidine kinase DesK|uniref:sensor histidine kinase n=1 Tax=Nonomuraea glycinis TaxID=2047744 RepID=UPI002E131E81|nr:histidine kinase [Nonomuraea glycinis]
MSAGRGAGLRKATKLDKVRWLILCSADLGLLAGVLGVLDVVYRWREGWLPAPLTVTAVALVLIVTVLASRSIRIAVRGGPRPTWMLAIAGTMVLLLTVIPIVWVMPLWLGMAAPFVRRRTLLLLSLASFAVITVYEALVNGFNLPGLLLQVAVTVVVAGGVLANLWLWRIAKEAYEGEEARALLAVSEERLRFARDLNDLLGQSLTDIATRTAGAEQALPVDPEAAGREMFEVRDLARQTLREVRHTVQSYRTLDLGEVLASVRAVLEAADVRCTVDAETGELTAETRTLLATVVREGATNVLKHSKAQHCTITIKEGILEMSNDGVTGPTGEHAPNGLGGLAQRVSTAGGALSAAPTPQGAYLLRVVVPA